MTAFGVVGLGIMGSAMASQLVKSGLGPVAVYNRSGVEPEDGWVVQSDLASLGRASDVVVLSVSTAEAVEQILSGTDGLLGAMEGGIVVNVATVGPDKATALARHVEEAGAGYLDAPVLGSKGAARSGDLTTLVAGAVENRRRCASLFQAVGGRSIEFDEVGDASKAKLIFNALLGIGMAAVVDALRLADSMGLERDFVVEEVLGSPVASPAMRVKGAAIAAGDQEVHFPLEWMLKDLRLAQELLPRDSVGVLDAAAVLFSRGVETGLAREDFSAVHRLWRP